MTPVTAVLLLAGRLVQAEGKGKRDRANELQAHWKGAIFYKKN